MFASKFLRTATAVAVFTSITSATIAQTTPGVAAVPADLAQAAPTLPGPLLQPQAKPSASAAPTALRNSVSASEIALINERMSVMQATLAELELQVKMATKRDELRKLNSGPIDADDGFTPSVVEIGGVDGKLIANLLMQGGNVQSVRVGDRIGGWLIKEITIDSLTMVKGKESKRLAFGMAIAQPPAGSAPFPGSPMQSPVPFMR